MSGRRRTLVDAHTIKYSYLDVPTLERFSESNARIRGILGPFRCMDGATEFLTPSGWSALKDYRPGDQVAQWRPSDGRIEFVEPTAYIQDSCDELIQFDSGSLVMRLTPNHRVPHYNWSGAFKIKTAAEMEAKPSKSTIPTTFAGTLVDGLGLSDDMIRFAVMMHADGHYPPRGFRAAVVLRKDRKKERLRELLSRLDIKVDEFVYPARPTETQFKFVAPYVGKRFDGAWWSASQRELAIVLDEMKHWDGHNGEICIYSSAYKTDADFIQYAAHANGLRAGISKVSYAKENWKPNYRVAVRMGDNAKNRAMVRSDTTAIERIKTTDGKAYCFTVPTGFFVARCADTIFITGNSGKSSASVVEMVTRGLAQRPGPDGIRRTRFIVVRNTFAQLEDSTIKTVHMWLPPMYFGKYNSSSHNYVVKAFENTEIEIWFRALDRPDHVRNLLSVEVTGAWFNEAREIPWAIVEAMDGRIGQFPPKFQGGPTWQGMWLDTNPPDIDSKWYKFFEETKHDPSRVEIFRQPSGLSAEAENLSNLPNANYYKDLAYGKGEDWINVYIHGKYGFVREGKAVFRDYSDRLHCQEVEPIAGPDVIRGWDFGLTPACTFSQVLPDGRWLVFDEMVSENMGIARFSSEVLDHCTRAFPQGTRFLDYGDPAGEQRAQTDERTVFDIMQAKGINIEGGEQGLNVRLESIRYALNTLRDGEPIFVLHPRCKTLRKAFQGAYHYRRMATTAERYTSEPEKDQWSHPMDALQYPATRLFGAAVTRAAPEEEDWPEIGEFGPSGRSDFTGY